MKDFIQKTTWLKIYLWVTLNLTKVIFSTSRVFTQTFGMILSILYFDTTQNFPKMAFFYRIDYRVQIWASIGQNKPKYIEKLWKNEGNLAQPSQNFAGHPCRWTRTFLRHYGVTNIFTYIIPSKSMYLSHFGSKWLKYSDFEGKCK